MRALLVVNPNATTTTAAGRDVLAGRTTWHGPDRWIGGVHLEGRTIPWRWDRRAGRLTRA